MRRWPVLMLVLAGCSQPAAVPAPADTTDEGRAAARVVERYYALVESGHAAEAATLRADGAVFDVTPFDRLNAQVRKARRVEGAAGSLYADVPVVLVGRYAGGGEYRASGKVTLKRSNDVPGATAAEREWRIEKIEVTTGY